MSAQSNSKPQRSWRLVEPPAIIDINAVLDQYVRFQHWARQGRDDSIATWRSTSEGPEVSIVKSRTSTTTVTDTTDFDPPPGYVSESKYVDHVLLALLCCKQHCIAAVCTTISWVIRFCWVTFIPYFTCTQPVHIKVKYIGQVHRYNWRHEANQSNLARTGSNRTDQFHWYGRTRYVNQIYAIEPDRTSWFLYSKLGCSSSDIFVNDACERQLIRVAFHLARTNGSNGVQSKHHFSSSIYHWNVIATTAVMSRTWALMSVTTYSNDITMSISISNMIPSHTSHNYMK